MYSRFFKKTLSNTHKKNNGSRGKVHRNGFQEIRIPQPDLKIKRTNSINLLFQLFYVVRIGGKKTRRVHVWP